MKKSYENEKDFVKRILDLNHDVAECQKYIKENFCIDSVYDNKNNILHLYCTNANEGLELVAAKQYVNDCIDESFVKVIYG